VCSLEGALRRADIGPTCPSSIGDLFRGGGGGEGGGYLYEGCLEKGWQHDYCDGMMWLFCTDILVSQSPDNVRIQESSPETGVSILDI
jgi:hypothetical protein